MKSILITGGAGFIGSSLIDFLLQNTDYRITSVDNFDPFYDKEIKLINIENHFQYPNFSFKELDITKRDELFEQLTEAYDQIIHLAAKAGVRPSIQKPEDYVRTNVAGTQNILDLAMRNGTKKIIFASSSSVYGDIAQRPWSENILNLNPISPYAATKIAGELLGKTYSNLYDMQFLALRFFTVYGSRQRPDLAIRKFTEHILQDKAITLFGKGDTSRDYTYIDDIVSGIVSAMSYNKTKYEIINLGNSYPVKLIDLVKTIERVIGKKSKTEYADYQAGDLMHTLADISKAEKLLGYKPQTSIFAGLEAFYKWFSNYKK